MEKKPEQVVVGWDGRSRPIVRNRCLTCRKPLEAYNLGTNCTSCGLSELHRQELMLRGGFVDAAALEAFDG